METAIATPRRICILGSTGSIGRQTIDIAKAHPDKIEVVGLATGCHAKELLEQARALNVAHLALGHEEQSNSAQVSALRAYAESHGTALLVGEDTPLKLIEACACDVVVNSLVGAYGLKASYETLLSGKVLALANKESLVVGGDLIMPLVRKRDPHYPSLGEDGIFHPDGILMPIDSEHGALYQCLLGENMAEVYKLWVTASGGPFRGMTRDQLQHVTAKQALAHPTWNMGPKITIDSSTLMNKGLEVIEAHHLFGASYDDINVVVQPQSAIHSMVEFNDGSLKAHLGKTDMRIPIQFALSYPKRWATPVERVDFCHLGKLEFEEPDTDTFRCLALAESAGRAGGTLPCAMNAANEVAVAAYLAGACSFLAIADCVEYVMDAHVTQSVSSIEQLVSVDHASRDVAKAYLSSRA